MTKHEFKELMAKRLARLITDDESKRDVREFAGFCYSYEFADEILEFMNENPGATLKELWRYFDENVPDGLAPGDDGADLFDEDEEEPEPVR